MSLNKSAIVDQARAIYQQRYGDKLPQRACLYWALAFNEAARLSGIRAILQAGTAQFQFCDDEGSNITHFSYMFDKVEATKRLSQNLWPEIHVWSGIPATGEIVDLSVRYQSQQALELAGLVWHFNYGMPDYLWQNTCDSKRFRYLPDRCATLLALSFTPEVRERVGL